TRPPGHGQPRRPVTRAALLEEARRVDAVGVAAERQRPAFEVRQHDRRDARVVVDDLALGEAVVRVEDLVEVGEAERPRTDLDDGAAGRAHEALRARPLALAGRASTTSATSLPSPAGPAAGCRLRASLAALTLASSAAMRSTTGVAGAD